MVMSLLKLLYVHHSIIKYQTYHFKQNIEIVVTTLVIHYANYTKQHKSTYL